MTDPLAERMETVESLSEQIEAASRERDAISGEIGERLAEHVEAAVAEHGTSVEPTGESRDETQFRFEARLDRAAMVATLADELPAGFTVSHLNDDGSLSIAWAGRDDDAPRQRKHDAILKAIVAEETATDSDGLITSVPSRERVLDRAEKLGVDRGAASDRLDRFSRLDMVDIEDGDVYPGDNFSRI
ncbi:MAG: hypothetical protein ABEH35_07040 [Haloarculaceae archaeon]